MSGIYVVNSSNNVFVDSTLTNSDIAIDDTYGDIAMEGTNSSDTTLVNISFNQSNVEFISSGSGLF